VAHEPNRIAKGVFPSKTPLSKKYKFVAKEPNYQEKGVFPLKPPFPKTEGCGSRAKP